MQFVSAGEFKTHCLKLMDQVAESHEELIVTKRGVPVVKMIPIETEVDPFDSLKGMITVHCDHASYGDPAFYELDAVWEANEA